MDGNSNNEAFEKNYGKIETLIHFSVLIFAAHWAIATLSIISVVLVPPSEFNLNIRLVLGIPSVLCLAASTLTSHFAMKFNRLTDEPSFNRVVDGQCRFMLLLNTVFFALAEALVLSPTVTHQNFGFVEAIFSNAAGGFFPVIAASLLSAAALHFRKKPTIKHKDVFTLALGALAFLPFGLVFGLKLGLTDKGLFIDVASGRVFYGIMLWYTSAVSILFALFSPEKPEKSNLKKYLPAGFALYWTLFVLRAWIDCVYPFVNSAKWLKILLFVLRAGILLFLVCLEGVDLFNSIKGKSFALRDITDVCITVSFLVCEISYVARYFKNAASAAFDNTAFPMIAENIGFFVTGLLLVVLIITLVRCGKRKGE